MKKILTLCLIAFIGTTQLNAQNYVVSGFTGYRSSLNGTYYPTVSCSGTTGYTMANGVSNSMVYNSGYWTIGRYYGTNYCYNSAFDFFGEYVQSGSSTPPSNFNHGVTVTYEIALTASGPSSTPTLCQNSTLTNITHTTSVATGIGSPSGLPAGVTAAWAANVITISGTPTSAGVYNYTIPLTGAVGSGFATGTITVNPANTANI